MSTLHAEHGATSAPQRALRADAAANRRRLLAAAEVVFAEHGLDGSVDEVARLAGVGMGTLYRRFPTKDALIAELVRELLTEVRELAEQTTANDDGHGLEQFLVASAMAHQSHRGCLARLWSDPQSMSLRDDLRELVATMLATAQHHGVVRPDATIGDVDLMFRALPGVIESTRSLGEIGWRRFLAIMLAGLSGEISTPTRSLTAPALSLAQSESLRAQGSGS